MVRPIHPGDGEAVRDRILEMLAESPTDAEDNLEALQQCAAHIRDRLLVETFAKELAIRPTRFLADENLELYYDLKRGRHEVGYISKGWGDPGFRIGDVIKVPPARKETLKAEAYRILRLCADI